MSINKVSLAVTALGSVFVFGILAMFGLNLLLAALLGMSLIVVNLIWTASNERKARRHAVAREARRTAMLAGSNDAQP